MYNKDYLKNLILEKLQEMKEKELPYGVRKLSIDKEGHITSFQNEKMIPLDFYNLGSFKASLKESLDDNLSKFIIAYLVKVKSLNFNSIAFEELFNEFEMYLNEGKYVYRSIALVHNLRIYNDIIDFQDFSLRVVDTENLEYIYNNVEDYYNKSNITLKINMNHHLANPSVLIEKKYISNKLEQSNSIRNYIEKLGQAIILNSGVSKHIFFSPIITFSYFENYGMIQSIEYINSINNTLFNGIVSVDCSRIIDMYNMTRKFDDNIVALDRLCSAHNKSNKADKFIDLMIALESLYPSINAEVTYRISLYTAIVLGSKREIFNRLKKLYSLRSNLVHGSSKLTNNELSKRLEELDDIVRNVINKSLIYLTKGKNLKDMETDIENTILPF